MRAETRRKLERALWRQRLKKVGLGVAVLAAIGLFFVYKDMDARVDDMRVAATVVAVGPLNGTSTKMVENGLSVDVSLDDGRRITVMALRKTDPHVGDHVQITEHHHRTGRVTYTWR
jgi:hypothetical protein